MASRTACADASVVEARTFERAGRFMAGLTGSRGDNVVSGFREWGDTCKGCTAMTSHAATHNTSMVHRRTSKASRRFMAGFASSRSRYVHSWFC